MTKSKPKSKRKRKTSYFSTNLEVKKKAEQLRQLEKSKNNLEKELEKIFNDYNNRSKSSTAEAEKMFERLPLTSLRELQDFVAGKKKETSMQILNIRAKLRKDHGDKLNELEKLREKISQVQKDLLDAKVNCVIEKLGNDDE